MPARSLPERSVGAGVIAELHREIASQTYGKQLALRHLFIGPPSDPPEAIPFGMVLLLPPSLAHLLKEAWLELTERIQPVAVESRLECGPH
jgi:hypothetical protein